MATFPSVLLGDSGAIPALEPEEITIRTKTMISDLNDAGEEKRKKKWLYPRRDFPLKYRRISKANAKTIWQLYLSQGGQYESLVYFLPFSDDYMGEYVGTGNGSDTVWNLPSKQVSSYTLYIDGQAQTEGVGMDWVFASEVGADGADKCTFAVAPNDGEKITFSFTGWLKVRCRFAEDNLSWQTFYNLLVNTGVNLQGLLNTNYQAV